MEVAYKVYGEVKLFKYSHMVIFNFLFELSRHIKYMECRFRNFMQRKFIVSIVS